VFFFFAFSPFVNVDAFLLQSPMVPSLLFWLLGFICLGAWPTFVTGAFFPPPLMTVVELFASAPDKPVDGNRVLFPPV